ITLIATNGFCPNDTVTISNHVSVQAPLGIEEEITAKGIRAYPNPFSDKITLEIVGFSNQKINIRIEDVVGRTVMTRELALNANNQIKSISLDFNNLNLINGLYVIQVSSSDYLSSFKVLKK
ncbi:MAG: T9SS type A sorting domain-containing protein, partial [Flavobacteriales bacterium]|nr:T9SS type A sorting domain-containing protein [Flavobacteriales bacterium]